MGDLGSLKNVLLMSQQYCIPKAGLGKCQSWIWATKSKGPKRVPCGHPTFNDTVDTLLPTLTCCLLFNKKLAAHFVRIGEHLGQIDSAATLVGHLQDLKLLKSHTEEHEHTYVFVCFLCNNVYQVYKGSEW